MLTEIFKGILLISATGGILSIFLLCLKPVTRKLFSPKWQYYIWLTVLIVMILPVRFSLPQRTPDIPAIATEQVQNVQTDIEAPIMDNQTTITEPERQAAKLSIPKIELPQNIFYYLSYIWILGAIFIFFAKIIKYRLFLRAIHKNSELDTTIENIPKRLKVQRTDMLDAPLIVGLIKPCLYLPDTELSESNLNYILRHELTHYRRYDLLYKWFTMLVLSVHWFNPLIHIVSKQIDLDCEVSCDAEVAGKLSKPEQNSYMNMILDMLANSRSNLRPLTTQMASNKKTLKRRFEMIRNMKKTSKFMSALSAILAVVMLGTTVFANGVLAGQFTGEGYSSWAKAELDKAREYKLIDTWYSFQDYQKEITREEFCKIAESLCLQSGITLYANGDMERQLIDVTQNQNTEAVYMYCMGIVPAKTDTLFAPNAPVTQEDAAVFLQNLFDYVHLSVFFGEYDAKSTEYRFADDSEISEIAKDSAYSMFQHNIMCGDGSGKFCPKQNLTAEKCVVLLTRLYEMIHSCYDNAEGLVYNQIQSIQHQVDNGHYPWRLDPTQTIWEYAHSNNVGYGEITELAGTGVLVSASYTTGGDTYQVEIYKPIRKDETGVWVVRLFEKIA